MRKLSKVLAVSGMSAALCAGSLVSAFARAASDDGYTYAGDAVGYVTFSELTEPVYVNWDVICDFMAMYYNDLGYGDSYYYSVTYFAEYYKSSLCLSDGTYIGDKYPDAATEYVEVTAEMAEDLNSIADAWGWGSSFAKDKPADTGYIAFAFAKQDAETEEGDAADTTGEDSNEDSNDDSNDDGDSAAPVVFLAALAAVAAAGVFVAGKKNA